MLTMLLGLYRPNVMCIIHQSNLTTWQSKNRCALVSLEQKQHCWVPCQFRLAKLSLVKITSQCSSQMKTFTLRGIFSCHNNLLIGKILSSMSAKYIECTENKPFCCKVQMPMSRPCTSSTSATLDTTCSQSLRLFPCKFLLKETFSGVVLSTFWTVSCLW